MKHYFSIILILFFIVIGFGSVDGTDQTETSVKSETQVFVEDKFSIDDLIGNTYSLDYYHQIKFKNQNEYFIYQNPLNCGGNGNWSIQGDFVVLGYNDSNCEGTINMSGKYPLINFK